jgi:hypothetical protein
MFPAGVLGGCLGAASIESRETLDAADLDAARNRILLSRRRLERTAAHPSKARCHVLHSALAHGDDGGIVRGDGYVRPLVVQQDWD